MRLRILLLLPLLLSACSHEIFTPSRPAVELYWPAPPEKARIAWIQEIRTAAEAGIREGLWRRFVRFVTGESFVPLGRPYGVYVDDEDRLYVTDPEQGIVHLYDRPGGRYRALGAEKEFARATPIGVTGDGGESVYITDSAGGRVLRYDRKDNRLSAFAVSLHRPTGIAFNPHNGLLYVSETGAHRVIALDRSGATVLAFGSRGTEAGRFNFPTDICVDAGGRIAVTDSLNGRVQRFSPEGVYLSSFGAPGDSPGFFAKPKGVAVDAAGDVFVADALFDAIQIFDAEGRLLMGLGRTGAEPGEFWMPAGIFIDRSGRIYAADAYNRRIQVFRIVQ